MPGLDPRAVQQQFAALFGVKPNRITPYFKGKKVFVKRNLDYRKAKKYIKAFQQIGIRYEVDPPIGSREFSGNASRDTSSNRPSPRQSNADMGANTVARMPYEDELTLQYQAESIKDPDTIRRQRSVMTFSLALLTLAAVFGLDVYLQSIYVDMGRLVYLVPLFFSVLGCSSLAAIKGHSHALGLLGLLSLLGLAVTLALKNKRVERDTSYLFRKQWLLPTVLTGIFVVWGVVQFERITLKRSFVHATNELAMMRSDYPANLIETQQREIDKVGSAIEQFVNQSLLLVRNRTLRPTETRVIADQIFKEVSKYFMWLQYQRYLHAKTTKKLPEFLSDRFVTLQLVKFKKLLLAAKKQVNHKIFTDSMDQWFGGMESEQLESVATMKKSMYEFKAAIKVYRHQKKQLPVNWEMLLEQQPQTLNLMEQIQWEQPESITLSAKKSEVLDGNTVVMALYLHPENDRLVYTRIGGTLPDKYMGHGYRIFSKTYQVGPSL